MFVVLASFRSFAPATLVGWTIGLFSGSVVLAHSTTAAAAASLLVVRPATGGFNLLSATAVGAGFLAAAATTLVIVAASGLVLTELARPARATRRSCFPTRGASPVGRLSTARSSRVR